MTVISEKDRRLKSSCYWNRLNSCLKKEEALDVYVYKFLNYDTEKNSKTFVGQLIGVKIN